jgi:hypothetical protein
MDAEAYPCRHGERGVMTKRYEFSSAGLIRLKARDAKVPTALMAATKDSNSGIDKPGHASANPAYYKYDYGLRDAGSAAPA